MCYRGGCDCNFPQYRSQFRGSPVKCEICDKIGVAGNNVSHSKRHTKTRFMPNVQKLTLPIKGVRRRVKICTRCLRTMHKTQKVRA